MRWFLFAALLTLWASGAWAQAPIPPSLASGGGGGGCSTANPTATAGPAAVNGSAATCMRSDAAPTVQKGSSAQFGLMECDNVTVTCPGGVLSASTLLAPTVTRVASGTTNTISSCAAVLCTVAWDSSTSSSKTQTIPNCAGGVAYLLAIKDQKGDAAANNITVAPVSAGTIEGGSTLVMVVNKEAITLQCDGVSDWMVE